MKFGENLYNLRKKSKMTQDVLAEKVGVSRQSVSKWENGEAYPEMDNILILCNIFNCKINDLVHEDLTDIDSLDEEVKMSVVKLKKEKQKRMKVLSKIIYIVARIGKILTIVSSVIVLITMIGLPIITSNIKIDGNKATVFNEVLEYQRKDGEIIIIQNGKEKQITNVNDLKAANEIIDIIENNELTKMTIFTEAAFACLVATLILLYLTFKHLEELFVNIHNGDTPFTIDNVKHIKMMSYLLIGVTLLPSICGVIAEVLMKMDVDIGFGLMDLLYIIILYSLSYIFEYGYEIQLDSKGKMYGDEVISW